jgi:Uma2 family endonuclease
MSMASPAKVWTVDMLESLPEDGNRYEIIAGELFVTPAPAISHERVGQRLGKLLDAYADAELAKVEVFFVPADIVKDKHNLVQPDVLVIDWSRGADQTKWPPMSSLMLAVEVLSPSTAKRDRTAKRDLYLSERVEYWIADPKARTIERWLPGTSAPTVLSDTLTWKPPGAKQALGVDIQQLFEQPKF